MQVTATSHIGYKNKYVFTAYSLYIILLTAACSDFAKTLTSQLVFISFSVFLLVKKNKRWLTDEFGVKFIFSSLLVILIQYTITNVFMFGSVKFILILASIYFMVKEYKSYFTASLTEIAYRLILITIPFYAVQIINLNLLKSILSPFNFSFAQQSNLGGLYVFLFNFNPAGASRNSGFMWEPGAFGAILIFLIIYEYIKNDKKVSKRIIFLSIYALTTISTTTYLGLLMFAFLILLKKNRNKPVVLFVSLSLFLSAAVAIYSLPFIGDKISFYFDNNLDYTTIDNNINGGYASGGTSIGRFSGLLVVLKRLPKSPIVGNGWDTDYSDLGLSNEWSNPNGLASLLGKFGVIGILFLVYGLYSFVSYSKGTVFENGILIVILLFPVFSNPFESNIIMWVLAMTGIYMRRSKQANFRSPNLTESQFEIERSLI